MKKYENAVKSLVELAGKSCGSSRAAAAVLLSAYDPVEYPLDITELCLFDPDYFAAAMLVISLRVWHNREPHECILNGSAIFDMLVADWGEVLHVNRRTTSRGFSR